MWKRPSRNDLGYVHQVLTFQRRQRGRVFDWAMNMATYFPELDLLSPPLRPRGAASRTSIAESCDWRLRELHVVACTSVPAALLVPSNAAVLRLGTRNATQMVLDEGGNDAEVRAAMYFVRALAST